MFAVKVSRHELNYRSLETAVQSRRCLNLDAEGCQSS
jgi:hypothetical protein